LILCKLGEYQEFAEALFGQLSVEINEEKEITELAIKAKESIADKVQFKELEDIAKGIFPIFKNKVEDFLGVKVPDNFESLYHLLRYSQLQNQPFLPLL